MAVFELPAIVALLLVQSPLPPPKPGHPCGTRSTRGFDCCLHLPAWSARAAPDPLPNLPPLSATIQTDGERTPTDVATR